MITKCGEHEIILNKTKRITMKDRIDHNRIDLLITTKMNVLPEGYTLDEESLRYLTKILQIYEDTSLDNPVEKYKLMLSVAGTDKVTKICRDIRLCVENLEIIPYRKEYDHSEESLSIDMIYVKRIIQENVQKILMKKISERQGINRSHR